MKIEKMLLDISDIRKIEVCDLPYIRINMKNSMDIALYFNKEMERDYPSDDALAINIIKTAKHYIEHGYIYYNAWYKSSSDIDDKLFLEDW